MLATQLGIINLVMRSPEDDQQIANAQAKPGELFAGPAKADRDKETLLPADPNLNEKTKGFLDFLNSAKGKASPGAATSADESSPRETWNMRVLKPGDVQDVEFEADAAKAAAASPSAVWKTTTAAGNAGGGHPPKAEPKTAAAETRRAAAAQATTEIGQEGQECKLQGLQLE